MKKTTSKGFIAILLMMVVLVFASCNKNKNNDATNGIFGADSQVADTANINATTSAPADTAAAQVNATATIESTPAAEDAADEETPATTDNGVDGAVVIPVAQTAADEDPADLTGNVAFDTIMAQINEAVVQGHITHAEAIRLREQAMEILMVSEVVISAPGYDATAFTRNFLSEYTIVDGQTIDLLTSVFDETRAATNYRDALFPRTAPVGGIPFDLREGQTLYFSAGHYTLALPDGRVVIRAFGEDVVANDYYSMPGRYWLIAYAVPETPERGLFSAIGGKIFSGTPSLVAELQGSFMRPMNLTVSTASHRQASQDGMGKVFSYSLFMDAEGNFQQTMTERLGERINIRVVDASLHVMVAEAEVVQPD